MDLFSNSLGLKVDSGSNSHFVKFDDEEGGYQMEKGEDSKEEVDGALASNFTKSLNLKRGRGRRIPFGWNMVVR